MFNLRYFSWLWPLVVMLVGSLPILIRFITCVGREDMPWFVLTDFVYFGLLLCLLSLHNVFAVRGAEYVQRAIHFPVVLLMLSLCLVHMMAVVGILHYSMWLILAAVLFCVCWLCLGTANPESVREWNEELELKRITEAVNRLPRLKEALPTDADVHDVARVFSEMHEYLRQYPHTAYQGWVLEELREMLAKWWERKQREDRLRG